jgi:hypothetical protein
MRFPFKPFAKLILNVSSPVLLAYLRSQQRLFMVNNHRLGRFHRINAETNHLRFPQLQVYRMIKYGLRHGKKYSGIGKAPAGQAQQLRTVLTLCDSHLM